MKAKIIEQCIYGSLRVIYVTILFSYHAMSTSPADRAMELQICVGYYNRSIPILFVQLEEWIGRQGINNLIFFSINCESWHTLRQIVNTTSLLHVFHRLPLRLLNSCGHSQSFTSTSGSSYRMLVSSWAGSKFASDPWSAITSLVALPSVNEALKIGNIVCVCRPHFPFSCNHC